VLDRVIADRAEIQGLHVNDVVVLPRSVLRADNTVLIANDQRQLEIRPVSVIRAEPKSVYISDGVEDGELVVTTSLDAPIPGMGLAISGEEPLDLPDNDEAEDPEAGQ